MNKFEKIDAVMEDFLVALKKMNDYYTFSHEKGSKYVKIVMSTESGQRSVYCFLDAEGFIYKPANWKAPATKHRRGSIFDDPNYSIGKGLGPYGAAYMR